MGYMLAQVSDATDAISGSDIGRLVVLLGGGGALLWFIVRNMVSYQKYFTNFYMEENVKLRKDVNELRSELDSLRSRYETEIEDLRSKLATKDDEIRSLRWKNQALQTEVDNLKERLKNAGLS